MLLLRRTRSCRSFPFLSLLCLVCVGSASATAADVVCGDTDTDGLFETEDIQQCIDSLAGPGPHRVTLVADTTFEPHFTDAASFYNVLAFVELESNITLDCQGSTIRGIDHLAKQSPSGWSFALSVLTNSDHTTASQSDIWVLNCGIDGGMPTVYDENAQRFDHDNYIAFSFDGVQGGGIVGSHVHDAHHACVYVRNSSDILIEDNDLVDCGGANNLGDFAQPAVYLFQVGAVAQERITVRRNRAVRAGRVLYATRISEANPEFQTAWMRDVLFENNYGDQQGNGAGCIMLRGVRGIAALGNTCVNSNGIQTTSLNTAYCSDNPDPSVFPLGESSCLEDVLIEGNTLRSTQSPSSTGAISVYNHHDGVTVRNNRVIGTEGPAPALVGCMRWETPLRDFEVDGFCGMRCDAWGIEQSALSIEQLGSPPNEAITLRNVVILEPQAEGALFRTRLEGLVVDGLAVRDSGGVPFLALDELVGETLTNLDFEDGPLPGWANDVCAPAVPALAPWATWMLRACLVVVGVIAAWTPPAKRRDSERPGPASRRRPS